VLVAAAHLFVTKININLNLNKQTFFKSICKGMFLKIKNINIVKAQEKCRKEHLTMIIYVKKFI